MVRIVYVRSGVLMIELQRRFKVAAFATSANVADHPDFTTNPVTALNAQVNAENSVLVVVREDTLEHRLYCGGKRISDFEVTGRAPYVVACQLNGKQVSIGSASGEPVVIDDTEYRTPPVFFTGGYVAEVTITKSAEGAALSNLTF
jgi:hypothetical protein